MSTDPDIHAARQRYVAAEAALDALWAQKTVAKWAAMKAVDDDFGPRVLAAQELFDEAEAALMQLEGDGE